jgi:PAS domain S-box-containing protein
LFPRFAFWRAKLYTPQKFQSYYYYKPRKSGERQMSFEFTGRLTLSLSNRQTLTRSDGATTKRSMLADMRSSKRKKTMTTRFPRTKALSILMRYGVALLSVLVTALLTLPLHRLNYPSFFSLFFVAIVLSAWYGGLGPGLLATGLTALVTFFFHIDILLGPGTYSIEWLIMFVLASLLISWLDASRRRAEEALRESEDRYRDLVEHSHDLICTHDLDGRILSVNQTAAKALGYAPHICRERNIRDALLPKFRDQFDDYIAELQRAGIAHGVMAIQTRSGEKRLWEYTNTLRTEGVVAPIVRGVARDVTEQRRAEQALKASEAELRALFAAMTDVILVLDAEGRHLKIAPTRPADLYKPAAERIGQTLHEVFPQEAADLFLAYVRRALGEGRKQEVEYSLSMGGEQMWFDGSVSPITKDTVLWIARDITERKRTEEEREQLLVREQEARLGAEVMRDANLALTQDLSLERVLETLLDYLHKLVPYDSANVMLAEGDSQFTVSAVRGYENFLPDVRLAKAVSFDANANALLGTIHATGQSLLIADTEDEPDWERVPGGEHVRNWMGVPLFANGKVIGLYSLDKAQPGFFTDEHVMKAELLAALAASAIQNARLFQQVERYAAELEQRIVERERADEALRKAEEKYRGIFENAVEGIFQSTPDGHFITANPALARMLGYDSLKELLSGRTDLARQHYVEPERRTELKRLLEAHGVVREFEHQAYRKDESKIWLSDNVRVVRDDGGAILYYEGFTEDITERKQVGEALRESYSLLRAVVEGTPDAVFVKDLQSRYQMINSAGALFLGQPAAEIIGKDDADYFSPESARKIIESDRRVLKAGKAQTFEETITAGGITRTYLTTKDVYCNSHGKVIGLIGIARDITDRKRDEAALSQSEQDYRSLFEQAHDAILVFSPEREIVLDVNERACEIYGFSQSEFIGMSLETISKDVARGKARVAETLEKGDYLNFETSQYRKDGAEIILEINASMVIYQGQVAILSINRDITERKRAEEMLQTFPRRLIETQEAERQRVARELHDEIGQALTAIKINLQNVQISTEVAPQLAQSMTTIDRALQQVRDLSFDLRPSLLDDLGLVAALRWHMDREAQRAGLISEFVADLLETRLSPELETACFRIAQEALTNVVRHAQANRVRVELRRRRAELHMMIRDDGVGFNARAVRNRRAAAVHLGLQGMQERALILGGQFKIKSAALFGTEIHAWFPLISADAGEERSVSR